MQTRARAWVSRMSDCALSGKGLGIGKDINYFSPLELIFVEKTLKAIAKAPVSNTKTNIIRYNILFKSICRDRRLTKQEAWRVIFYMRDSGFLIVHVNQGVSLLPKAYSFLKGLENRDVLDGKL